MFLMLPALSRGGHRFRPAEQPRINDFLRVHRPLRRSLREAIARLIDALRRCRWTTGGRGPRGGRRRRPVPRQGRPALGGRGPATAGRHETLQPASSSASSRSCAPGARGDGARRGRRRAAASGRPVISPAARRADPRSRSACASGWRWTSRGTAGAAAPLGRPRYRQRVCEAEPTRAWRSPRTGDEADRPPGAAAARASRSSASSTRWTAAPPASRWSARDFGRDVSSSIRMAVGTGADGTSLRGLQRGGEHVGLERCARSRPPRTASTSCRCRRSSTGGQPLGRALRRRRASACAIADPAAGLRTAPARAS